MKRARSELSSPARVTDYRALAGFRRELRLFLVFSEEQARAAGLEPQQHQVLLALKGLEEGQRPTIRALAESLVLKHHTVVGLVDRLATKKLVARRKSDADGREILVLLTPAGERLIQGLADAHTDELTVKGPALLHALESILSPTRLSPTR